MKPIKLATNENTMLALTSRPTNAECGLLTGLGNNSKMFNLHKQFAAVLKEKLHEALPDTAVKLLLVLKRTLANWLNSDPFRNSAVISYYAIFSLPGLLVITVNIVSIFMNRDIVVNEITNQIALLVGQDAAENVRAIINNVRDSDDLGFTTLMGLGVLLFGATGVFYHIQLTLNEIWAVQPKQHTEILTILKDRLFSFGLVISLGFLLLVSLLVSTALNIFSDWLSQYFSDGVTIVFHILNFAVSLSLITALFAAIFKYIPDIEIKFRVVITGSIITALLFLVSETLLGIYFSHSDPASTYGAAGSIVLIMLWVSYSSMVLMLGAHLTRQIAVHVDENIQPSTFAETADNKATNNS